MMRITEVSDNPRLPSLDVRIRRKRAWDEEGVASTVGTILALLVFLTFLGMFVNQYVPVWMKENENSHMNEVIGQFSNLKWGIDTLVITSGEGETASPPIYTPIKLHCEGIPVFASPTVGALSFTAQNPSYPWFSVEYPYQVTDTQTGTRYYVLDENSGGKAGGSLEFVGANRYFIGQTVAYENGAIILNQSDGETVLSGMAIRIVKYGDELIVKLNQISLQGTNKTVGGFGTKGVSTTLEYSTYSKFLNSSGGALNISINSKYGYAWESYFTNMLTSSPALTSSDWSVSRSTTVVGEMTYHAVTVTIENVNVFEFTRALVSVTIADITV